MKIGVDYYPEQWDSSMWNRDAELMLRTGVKIVRIADFAWSRIEPQENCFNFDWLDNVVGIFENYGIEIMLCTPTNSPPLWLYEKYPEIIRVGNKRTQMYKLADFYGVCKESHGTACKTLRSQGIGDCMAD